MVASVLEGRRVGALLPLHMQRPQFCLLCGPPCKGTGLIGSSSVVPEEVPRVP